MPNNSDKIQAIIFDMGHVFVDFEWEQVCHGFCQVFEIDSEAFKPILRHISTLGYETGHIDTAGLLKEVEKLTQKTIAEEHFHTLWNATFRENQTMAELLPRLKEKFPLYLLSNTNESHWNYLENTYNVSRHFDELVLSYEVGYAKPHDEIYLAAIKHTGKQAAECLFVDDLTANIEAAARLGLKTHLFTTPEKFQDSLKHFGIAL